MAAIERERESEREKREREREREREKRERERERKSKSAYVGFLYKGIAYSEMITRGSRWGIMISE